MRHTELRTDPRLGESADGRVVVGLVGDLGDELRVGDRVVLVEHDDGLIDDFTVMVRPLSGATALAEAMGAQFERIAREAVGG